MSPMRSLPCLPILAALLLSGAVAAQGALPELRTQGDVSWLSGGVGGDESAAIKAARDRFSLSLTLSARGDGRDVYLADVPVAIHNSAGGTVLATVTEGPYLLVKLPPGHYEVTATYYDDTRTLPLDVVAGKPKRLSLSWPRVSATPGMAAATTAMVPTVAVPSPPGVTAPVPAASVSGSATAATVPPSEPTPIPPPPATAMPAAAAVAAVAPAADGLPAVQTQGGIPYVSGGIGAEESGALKAAAARYSLSVMLGRMQDGHNVFLADVPVTVRDASGSTVLDVVSQGPYLLADLPPGDYRVSATVDGQEKSAPVKIAAGRNSKLSFSWAD